MQTRLKTKNNNLIAIGFRNYKEMNNWIKDSKKDIEKVERYSNTRINIFLKNGNVLEISK